MAAPSATRPYIFSLKLESNALVTGHVPVDDEAALLAVRRGYLCEVDGLFS